jgi:hypothetical protein
MIIIALFTSFTLSFLGLFCLLSPRGMQAYALKHSAKRLLSDSALGWMSTPKYLLYLRLMGGIISVAGSVATAILAIKWFKTWSI